MSAMFFQGSVAEAIAASRREVKPLIVLLTGFDQGSREVQDALLALSQEKCVAGCIVLALEDDLADTDSSRFADAKHFRAFCPLEQLPAVVMVSPGGSVLTKATGAVPPEELQRSLATAYEEFVHQQASLVAAQAALMAMTAGGRGAPSSAAGSASAAAEATASVGPDAAAAAARGPAAGEAEAVAAPGGDAEAGERGAAPVPAPAVHQTGGEPPAVPPCRQDSAEESPAAEQLAAEHRAAAEPAAEQPPKADAAAALPPAGDAGAAEAVEQPDPAALPYRLQFKFTDGTALRGDFTCATQLADVFAWIDEQRAAGGASRGLAYVLVQASPRRVLGAGEEGLALAAAGVLPRTSLQVIPHAAQGHRPPAPPAAESGQNYDAAAAAAEAAEAAGAPGSEQQQIQEEQPERQEGPSQPAAATDVHAQLQEARAAAAAAAAAQKQGKEQRQRKAAAARQEAAAPPPAPPPEEIQLQVRLSNGDSLRATFPSGSRLAAVYDWLDAERTDRGAYRLRQPFPQRMFYSGDLGSTLLALGFSARTSLQLELLPPRSKARATAPPAAAAAAAAAAGEVLAAAAQASGARGAVAAAAVPGDFLLQFKLTDGQHLRASFPPEATLQQVVHHLDTHRTDGGVPYALVQPFPKRRFAAEDLPLPLTQLGLQQRQLLLLEPLAGGGGGGGGGWSLRGVLAAAAGYLNPYAYLHGGAAGTARETQGAAAADAAPSSAAATEQLPSGGSGSAASPSRKRTHCGAAAPAGGANIHTLGGSGSGGGGPEDSSEPGGNSYWNGNSTQFGAPPPEDR